jgi:hypothetical protein
MPEYTSFNGSFTSTDRRTADAFKLEKAVKSQPPSACRRKTSIRGELCVSVPPTPPSHYWCSL